ncbi:hypothetical protein [Petroclostridium sp. X23]|uniref:hypothetical protein n=1 Tax=Petroclostridium sp. X23 TaxID=3045146 RepID=UPI0024ADC533|nr:hypothetical protein [Petroclostridium sp. X23]WHH59127.1 hypothetical protein QKW49_25635 [Petroclostridium sp. X23]
MIYSPAHLLQVIILITIIGGGLIWMAIEWPQIKEAAKRDYPIKSDFAEILKREIQKAKLELEIAEKQFEEADQEFIEAATYKWKAAERKYATLIANSKALYKEAV